jgi:hypothetical protein
VAAAPKKGLQNIWRDEEDSPKMGKGFEGEGCDIDQRVVERLECRSGKGFTTPGV